MVRTFPRIRNLFFYTFMIILAMITLFPFLWLLITSFKHPIEIFSTTPTFFPNDFTFDNYKFFFTGFDERRGIRIPIQKAFVNSIIIALGTSLISVFVGTCAAYAIARRKLKWMLSVLVIIIGIRTIPRISIVIPLYLFIQKLGLLDTLFGVMISHITFTLPIATFMMYSFFNDIPVSLEEAATVDGATRMQSFLKIIIPIVTPGLAVAMILSFVFSYNDFLYALVLVSTPNAMTLPVALSQFILQFGIAWELMASIGTLATIPVIIFSFIVQKNIVKGLTLGAEKG